VVAQADDRGAGPQAMVLSGVGAMVSSCSIAPWGHPMKDPIARNCLEARAGWGDGRWITVFEEPPSGRAIWVDKPRFILRLYLHGPASPSHSFSHPRSSQAARPPSRSLSDRCTRQQSRLCRKVGMFVLIEHPVR